MFFSVIALLSAVVSTISCAFGFVHSTVGLVQTFCINFIGIFLIWAVSCVVCTVLVDLEKPARKRSRIYRWYANSIIALLKQVLRIRLHVTGLEQLPAEQFLLVGNHRSGLDPILEMGVFRHRHMGFVAKQELFKIPVIGKIMHKCFCLSLDRGDAREGMRTIMQGAELIKWQTASLGIYPEGTRNSGNSLLPFKNGAFKIAQKAGCPIVVAVIRNSELVLKRVPFQYTDVYIDIVGIIDGKAAMKTRTNQLSCQVRGMMEQGLLEQ